MKQTLRILILSFFLIHGIDSWSQSKSPYLGVQLDPQFSHFMFNQLYFNPATAGAENMTKFQIIHRTQWANYQAPFDEGGSPGQQIFTASLPLNGWKSGVGLQFLNDKLGPISNQDIALSYAYKFNLSNGSVFSVGARGGYYTRSLNYNLLRPNDLNDDLIKTGSYNENRVDLGLGVYYNAGNYFVGASMMHINDKSKVSPKQLYLNAGYKYYLSDEFEIMPTILYKTDFVTNTLNGGLMFTYSDKYWLGGSYRAGDAGIIIVGVSMLENNALRLGYALDLTTNGTAAKSPTSHEILLSYSIPAPRVGGKKSIIRTPRFRH
jgi:type IX secretion system PorP/SprF family membrane protein